MALWIVRAGKYGQQEQDALEKKVITIGWDALPDLTQIHQKEHLTKIYTKIYDSETKTQISNRVSQIWRFCNFIKIGNLVVMPLKKQASIAIGEVTGNYTYNKNFPNTKHRRSVDWKEIIPRSKFNQDILYSFGSLLTVSQSRAEDIEQRVRHMLKSNSNDQNNSDTQLHEENPFPDLEEISRDSIIKFLEKKFKGHDLARLVNGILLAKGFTTKISSPGPDGGVDILAASGKLGFDEPKICIQVKSSRTPVDVKVVRELGGVMKHFDASHGILVTWSGLTKSAYKEINKAFFETRVWDQGTIVKELTENYDNLDDELKAEIPLQKIWTIIE